jgi:glutamine amidotransferase
MGNLRSAQKGLAKAGVEAIISDDARDIDRAETVILPGVGAFRDCFEGLKSRGMVEPLRRAAKSGKPFLGICVGLQLMFEGSEEGDVDEGLGIFGGRVVRFPRKPGLKVPHMGWNELRSVGSRPCPLLRNLSEKPFVYFVHSYYAQPSDPSIVLATSDHGVEFPALVGRDNVFAVQFHPEKSQAEGIGILKAFGEFARREA